MTVHMAFDILEILFIFYLLWAAFQKDRIIADLKQTNKEWANQSIKKHL